MTQGIIKLYFVEQYANGLQEFSPAEDSDVNSGDFLEWTIKVKKIIGRKIWLEYRAFEIPSCGTRKVYP